jgi:hypothetical protein
LYGVIKSFSEARWRIFKKNQDKEHKVTDLASLPPCKQDLQYHAKRVNVVAYLWRNSSSREYHASWTSWKWLVPTDEVETILFETDNENEEYAIGSDVQSNDEDEIKFCLVYIWVLFFLSCYIWWLFKLCSKVVENLFNSIQLLYNPLRILAPIIPVNCTQLSLPLANLSAVVNKSFTSSLIWS